MSWLNTMNRYQFVIETLRMKLSTIKSFYFQCNCNLTANAISSLKDRRKQHKVTLKKFDVQGPKQILYILRI